MKKLTNKEHAERLAAETVTSSKAFMDMNKLDSIDRSHWAFLHAGYITALENVGYSEKDCKYILKTTQLILALANK